MNNEGSQPFGTDPSVTDPATEVEVPTEETNENLETNQERPEVSEDKRRGLEAAVERKGRSLEMLAHTYHEYWSQTAGANATEIMRNILSRQALDIYVHSERESDRATLIEGNVADGTKKQRLLKEGGAAATVMSHIINNRELGHTLNSSEQRDLGIFRTYHQLALDGRHLENGQAYFMGMPPLDLAAYNRGEKLGEQVAMAEKIQNDLELIGSLCTDFSWEKNLPPFDALDDPASAEKAHELIDRHLGIINILHLAADIDKKGMKDATDAQTFFGGRMNEDSFLQIGQYLSKLGYQEIGGQFLPGQLDKANQDKYSQRLKEWQEELGRLDMAKRSGLETSRDQEVRALQAAITAAEERETNRNFHKDRSDAAQQAAEEESFWLEQVKLAKDHRADLGNPKGVLSPRHNARVRQAQSELEGAEQSLKQRIANRERLERETATAKTKIGDEKTLYLQSGAYSGYEQMREALAGFEKTRYLPEKKPS